MRDQKVCLLSKTQFFIEEDKGNEHPLELLLLLQCTCNFEEFNIDNTVLYTCSQVHQS